MSQKVLTTLYRFEELPQSIREKIYETYKNEFDSLSVIDDLWDNGIIKQMFEFIGFELNPGSLSFTNNNIQFSGKLLNLQKFIDNIPHVANKFNLQQGFPNLPSYPESIFNIPYLQKVGIFRINARLNINQRKFGCYPVFDMNIDNNKAVKFDIKTNQLVPNIESISKWFKQVMNDLVGFTLDLIKDKIEESTTYEVVESKIIKANKLYTIFGDTLKLNQFVPFDLDTYSRHIFKLGVKSQIPGNDENLVLNEMLEFVQKQLEKIKS